VSTDLRTPHTLPLLETDTADALLAALPGRVAVLAPSGELLAVSAGWRAFAARHGVHDDPMWGMSYLARCTVAGVGEDRARVVTRGLRALFRGSQAEFALDHPGRPPDEERWFRLRAVPLQWQGIRAALLTHEDITAETVAASSAAMVRARTEQDVALARIAEQAELLDQAHDAIIVRGLDHKVLYWNAGAEKVYGWPVAEAMGRDVRELVSAHLPTYDRRMEALLRDGSCAAELRARRKDGSSIWIHATWTLLPGNGERPDRVLAICYDVTLRRQIADALARSRAMLETGQALARLAGAGVDCVTGVVESTSGIVGVLGLAQQPRSVADLAAAMAPASAAAFLRRVNETPGEPFDMELEVHGSGGRRWVHAMCAGGGAAGPAHVSTLVFQDLTAMHDAREEILRLNASLERRVQRRTRQLQQANHELEAFSYSVSHDLKAPLAAIDGFTLVLSERLKDRVDERELGYMRRVREGVASMFGLIDAMLALHQLTRATEVQRTRVDLSGLAQTIVAELRAAEPQRPCHANIEPGIVVVGDAHLLANALRNLIGNSWKFSAQKPQVVLEIALDPQGPEGFTTMRLTDHGAGFDPKYAGKLFAPFQRLHHASEFPGTGVGLASVQRIAQQHGGMIRAHGVPDGGATFWLSLPVVRGDAADSTREE
jgi:PAS domain S-box-containing protein